MFKKILAWLKRPKIEQKSRPLKTLRDLDFFDTVWIIDKRGIPYEGWIYDKTKKHIIATVIDETGYHQDFRFIINYNDLNKSYLEQNHIKIYFDYQCWQQAK